MHSDNFIANDKYLSLINNMDQGYCVIELIHDGNGKAIDYRFLEINPAFERHTGITNGVGKTIKEIAPAHEDHWFRIYDDIAKTGVARHFEDRAAALNRVYDVFAFRPDPRNTKQVAVLFTDVSDRILSREKLEISEAFSRHALESSPDCVKIIDKEGRIDFMISNGLCLMDIENFGDITGKEWWQLWGDESSGLVKSAVEKAKEGKGSRFSAFCTTAKGTPKWWDVMVSPVLDAEKKVTQIISVSRDISESREAKRVLEENEIVLQEKVDLRTAELKEANASLLISHDSLRRSNINLEEFAHAASHDLKEPVRKIQFFTGQLKAKLAERLDDEENRTFQRIEKSVTRMGELIDDLLRYSHVSDLPLEKETVDLKLKVSKALEDLELEIAEKNAVIEVGDLPVISGYKRQLQQLFQNLISNALKYTQPGEQPHIKISAEKLNRSGAEFNCITVADEGIGFEQEYAKKIFQMFARLHGKAQYSGTGIGLSIVKKVVDNHGGFIETESSPGHGAAFRIFLPA